MCSEGVSVWFACKLCKSFFLNADDFAYHKKKSHVQQFRSTKFIVFEEQATPTASPPENWVSFLPPREETQIHKIISSPPPPTPTATNVDSCDTSNENVTTNPSEEFIKLDSKSNVFIVNNRDGGGYDRSQGSNNCFELNSNFNSNIEAEKALFAADIQEIDLAQSSIGPKNAALESTMNNLDRSNKKIPNVVSKKVLLQTEIQSAIIPYVSLKRLNLRAIQNASASHSNNTIDSRKNDKSNTINFNPSAKSAKQPQVKAADQKSIITSKSVFPSSPLVAVGNCKFCSEHFTSAAELHIHEDFCRLRSQFENILCVPCLLTFASSDELIRHNHDFHFGSISNPTAVADDLKVASKKQFQSDILPNVYNISSLTKIPLSLKAGDHLHNIDFNPNADLDLDTVSIADKNYSGPQNPNLYIGDPVEGVKTEYVADGNEDCELPSEDRDPFESVSAVQVESSVEPALNLSSCSPNNSEGNHEERLPNQPRSSRFYCISCQKYFNSKRDLKIHNTTHHRTQEGKGNFACPYPNCGKISRRQDHLSYHMQVHSIIKSFKCPHPNCGKAYKRPDNRNRHYKMHLNTSPRYCFSCKKYLTTGHELRSHNQTYHMAKEGKPFFNCPYPNCGRKLGTQDRLKTHLKLLHSKAQPFTCLHPNCKMYFKTANERNTHFDCHTRPT